MTQAIPPASSDGPEAQPPKNPVGAPGGPLLEITPRNILSFGPDTEPLRLRSLNVLIGPNGSGKSNLLDCIALLRGAPVSLARAVQKAGGVGEWIWKGRPDEPASVDVLVAFPGRTQPLRHVVSFGAENQAFRVVDERIEDEHVPAGEHLAHSHFEFQEGAPTIRLAGGEWVRLNPERVNLTASILSQRRDPDVYPELTRLTETYERIRFHRDWSFGRNTRFRQPQRTDAPNDRLEEDFSNLGLVLSRLRRIPSVKADLLSYLRDLYEEVTDFDVSVEGGTVQVFFAEGDFTIPATRLSDGSLRYLCLLAILCDPSPPAVVCIEEPELGMHPDLIPKIADLLVAASERCQLIVTTHSSMLVDALSEQPESIVVCEKTDGATTLRRLDADELAPWLEKYRLGQLWIRGKLGGTRW